MVTKIRDRYGNQIELTEERWHHIVTYHPELEDCWDEVLETIQKGVRKKPVKRKRLRYHYDREADVMYFYFDRLRKAKTMNTKLSSIPCGNR